MPPSGRAPAAPEVQREGDRDRDQEHDCDDRESPGRELEPAGDGVRRTVAADGKSSGEREGEDTRKPGRRPCSHGPSDVDAAVLLGRTVHSLRADDEYHGQYYDDRRTVSRFADSPRTRADPCPS
jgi:hypothetical protein